MPPVDPKIGGGAGHAAICADPSSNPVTLYTDERAGGLMTTVEVVLRKGMTAEQAIAHLQAVAPDSETVHYLSSWTGMNDCWGSFPCASWSSLRPLHASKRSWIQTSSMCAPTQTSKRPPDSCHAIA